MSAEKTTELETGLRELLDKLARGYVDAPCVVRLRRLVGLETADEITLGEIEEARRDRPAVKIDLSTHAALARAAAVDERMWAELVVQAVDERRWADAQSATNARHVAANGPQAVLALIERILELENMLFTVTDQRTSQSSMPSRADVKALLEKGVVLR